MLFQALAAGAVSAQTKNPAQTVANSATNSGMATGVSALAIDDHSPMAASLDGGTGYVPDGSDRLKFLCNPGGNTSNKWKYSDKQQSVYIQTQIENAVENALPDRGKALVKEIIGDHDVLTTKCLERLSPIFDKLTMGEQLILGHDGKAAYVTIKPIVRAYLLIAALTRNGISIDSIKPVEFARIQAELATLGADLNRAAERQGPTEEPIDNNGPRGLSPPARQVKGVALSITAGARSNSGWGYYERVSYSDGFLGYDMDAQVSQTNPNAFSIGSKLDLSPGRWERARSLRLLFELIDSRCACEVTLPERAAFAVAYYQLKDEAIRASSASHGGLHIVFSSALTTVNTFGSVYAYGLSAGKILARSGDKWAVGGIVNVQQLQFTQDGGTSKIGPRTLPSIALFWQNGFPDYDPKSTAPLTRWRSQIGLEASFTQVLGTDQKPIQQAIHNVYDVYLRRRLKDFNELKVLGGVDAINRFRFGIEFTHTIKD